MKINALKFGRTSNLSVYLDKQTNKTMTTLLQQFRAADQKVTEIQENGTMFNEATGQHETTCGDDFDAALELARNLHAQLEETGINPFS